MEATKNLNDHIAGTLRETIRESEFRLSKSR